MQPTSSQLLEVAAQAQGGDSHAGRNRMSEPFEAVNPEHPHLPFGHLFLAFRNLANSRVAASVGSAGSLLTYSRAESLKLKGFPARGTSIAGSLIKDSIC